MGAMLHDLCSKLGCGEHCPLIWCYDRRSEDNGLNQMIFNAQSLNTFSLPAYLQPRSRFSSKQEKACRESVHLKLDCQRRKYTNISWPQSSDLARAQLRLFCSICDSTDHHKDYAGH